MTYSTSTKASQVFNKKRKVVRKAFDAEKLIDLCVRQDFSDYAERFDLEGTDRFYWYKDNGSPILAVAHLDSVQKNGTCTVTRTSGGLLACSGALDDRLGVYTILELLPALGIKCDWLLTTDEEMGQSTAEEFYTDSKQYNWMFQFDRGGTDVVMYDYETPERAALVKESGARVGQGSFSDICNLTQLECAGFNWGVGYQDYHSPRSHAWLEDTFRMVTYFVDFYKDNKDKKFPYSYTSPDWGDDIWHRDYLETADCGHPVDISNPITYNLIDKDIY